MTPSPETPDRFTCYGLEFIQAAYERSGVFVPGTVEVYETRDGVVVEGTVRGEIQDVVVEGVFDAT